MVKHDVSTRSVKLSTTRTASSPFAVYSSALLFKTVVKSAEMMSHLCRPRETNDSTHTVCCELLQRQALIWVSTGHIELVQEAAPESGKGVACCLRCQRTAV